MANDNILNFPIPEITHGDIDPELVTKAAADMKFKSCLIIGYDSNENLYFASSTGDNKLILWLLESAKMHILSMPDIDDEDI